MRKVSRRAVLLTALGAVTAPALADEWPTRPIIMWNRAATCMAPYVKGYVTNVNSVYNGFRHEDVWLDK